MAIQSAANAVRDAVGAWLQTLTFTRNDGSGSYQLAANRIRTRPPEAGEAIQYPMVALILKASYALSEPHPVSGSRDPEEGDGTYLERLGELRGTVDVVIFADDVDREDEMVAGIELAAVPDTEDTDVLGLGRIVLTATGYHDAPVRLALTNLQMALDPSVAQRAVYRPMVTFEVAVAVLRARVAADFLPRIHLTVDDDGEYEIDPEAGTTEKLP